MTDVTRTIADIFAENGWQWRVNDDYVVPDSYDIARALDEVMKMMYDRGLTEGDRIEMGRLILEKTADDGLLVYSLVGEYR